MRHLSTAYGTVHRQGLTGVETTLIAVLGLAAWEGDVSLAGVGPGAAHATTVGGWVRLVPAEEEDLWACAWSIHPVQLEELGERRWWGVGGGARIEGGLLGDIRGRRGDADNDCDGGTAGF